MGRCRVCVAAVRVSEKVKVRAAAVRCVHVHARCVRTYTYTRKHTHREGVGGNFQPEACLGTPGVPVDKGGGLHGGEDGQRHGVCQSTCVHGMKLIGYTTAQQDELLCVPCYACMASCQTHQSHAMMLDAAGLRVRGGKWWAARDPRETFGVWNEKCRSSWTFVHIPAHIPAPGRWTFAPTRNTLLG